ncbi:MAG: leucine-rich repeat domain-containing protein, partial [archaeon]|nr:leucine-rich repeat domain-containing protein [archaeon]
MEETDNEIFFEANFNFIREDVFLIARVDKETGDQQLIIQKINPETKKVEIEESIECIHTPIISLPPEMDYYIPRPLEYSSYQETYKEVLSMNMNTELKKELEPKMKFDCLKSWIEEIAKNGVNSIYIKKKWEKSSIFYPVLKSIMKFYTRIDNSFFSALFFSASLKENEYLKKNEEFQEVFFFEAKYNFIREDVFLIARVNAGTGKQELIMQKINPENGEVEIKDSIVCIHTAVMDMSVREFSTLENDTKAQKNLYKKTLNIRWSEDPKTINLTPSEHFKAFKSWVAGIAEAGKDAFDIQDEIDRNLNLMYPIMKFIMRFYTRVDKSFISEYLSKIERECRFEGERHEESLIANLLPILQMLIINPDVDDVFDVETDEYTFNEELWEYCEYNDCYYRKDWREILSLIFEINPPSKLFLHDELYIFFLSIQEARIIKNGKLGALFELEEIINRKFIIQLNDLEYRGKPEVLIWDKKITEIYIPESNISKIPECIKKFTNLVVLWISNCKFDLSSSKCIIPSSSNEVKRISTIPKFIGELEKLEELVIRDQSITEIPDHIKNLKDLRRLWLDYNNLSVIPSWIDELSAIEDLSMMNNKISKIPKNLGDLKQLESLDLIGNPIKSIPENLGMLPNLYCIIFETNHLEQKPKFFENEYYLENGKNLKLLKW